MQTLQSVQDVLSTGRFLMRGMGKGKVRNGLRKSDEPKILNEVT